jgi:hypothetical protein
MLAVGIGLALATAGLGQMLWNDRGLDRRPFDRRTLDERPCVRLVRTADGEITVYRDTIPESVWSGDDGLVYVVMDVLLEGGRSSMDDPVDESTERSPESSSAAAPGVLRIGTPYRKIEEVGRDR